MMRNTTGSYGSVSKFFHWLIVLLVLIMVLLGYFMGDISNGYWSGFAYNAHKLMGLSIFALMIFRLIWKCVNPTPRLPPIMPKWQVLLAQWVQGLLYATLMAMPFTGWLMATAYGAAPHIGSFSLAMPFIPKSIALASFFDNTHSVLAIVILCLTGMHTLGALKHYLIDNDGVMQKMLPHCCISIRPAGRKRA